MEMVTMHRLNVPLPGREYEILIERGLLDKVGKRCRAVLMRASRIALITDSNVGPLYADRVKQSLEESRFQVKVITIPAGETSKSPEMLAMLWEELMAFGITRTDAIAALGGGVVGDLAGFAAATILRGIDYVQIPTTLLAQVDSSVGGKVAVDLKAGKNLAGAFWQPRMVVMDPDVLETLSDKTFADGMAEVIKYGCIWDASFFEMLDACGSREGVMQVIEQVLHICCAIKSEVVLQDEHDTGLRMILNFGHTLGHAYEKAYNYETYTHGEAVAAGMCRAAELGVKLGRTPADVPEKIISIVKKFGLPDCIACSMEDYRAAIGLDKKGQGDRISLIVLPELGKAQPIKLKKTELLDSIREP
ncbi:MAG: 3-dehydroquinate synthase [Oscillospiraceae bacterium]|nr:3-dehydroquinate synthase [Oscillospiraceae bacterium]